jgi:hypothetical protein
VLPFYGGAGDFSFSDMTPTDIANMALSRLGEPRLSSIEENTPTAISCRQHFATVRDSLLRAHAWNFATTRAQLSLTTTPAFGWDYAYTLPADFLRLCTFNGRQAKMSTSEFILEGGLLLADVDGARITYVRRMTDLTDADPCFIETLVFRLSAAIAIDVTNSSAKRDEMEGLANRRLADASFFDATEFPVEIIAPFALARTSFESVPSSVGTGAPGPVGPQGDQGADGSSAYEIAVENGFSGTESDWLASLVGPEGIQGPPLDFYNAFEYLSLSQGYDSTGDWADSLVGPQGGEGPQGDPGPAGPNEVSTSTSTNITGILLGNGSTVVAAVAGTDYAPVLTSAQKKTEIESALASGGAISVAATGTNNGIKVQASGTGAFQFQGGSGTGMSAYNLTEYLDANGSRIGYIYHEATSGKMLFMNERSGPIAFGNEGADRFIVYTSGGIYIGNSASDPGANSLLVQGNVSTNSFLRSAPTTVSSLGSATNDGAIRNVTDALGPVLGDVVVGGGSSKITVRSDGANWRVLSLPSALPTFSLASLNFMVSGGGSVITTGIKGYLRVPYDCTIQSAELVADQSGSIVIDIWRDSYANFPPTVGDSIVASAKPTLSSAQKSQNTTLTGWTTTLTEGQYLVFNVDSVSTVTHVLLTLKVLKS